MTDHTALDNPPAFPRTGEGFGNPKYDSPGMTLRDYFAGQALAGWMASYDSHADHPCQKDEEADHYSQVGQNIARWSYALADAMLALRAKGVQS